MVDNDDVVVDDATTTHTADDAQNLLKTIVSICPSCRNYIKAKLHTKNNKVILRKRCNDHGEFETIYFNDVRFYRETEALDYFHQLNSLQPPTLGAVYIDITTCCNLDCPICYLKFNSKSQQRKWHLPYLKIIKILKTLNSLKTSQPATTSSSPQPLLQPSLSAPLIIFTGGEPTLHPDLPKLIHYATYNLGFKTVGIVTNGIRFAEEPEYISTLVDAGLKLVFLSFDGFKPETYIRLRGKNLLDLKLKAITNCSHYHQDKLKLILNMLVVPELNDDELNKVLQFVLKMTNTPALIYTTLSHLPTFANQYKRLTYDGLATKLIAQLPSLSSRDDLYPPIALAPLFEFIKLVFNITTFERYGFYNLTHPHCSFRVYFIRRGTELKPLQQILDLKSLSRTAVKLLPKNSKKISKLVKLRLAYKFLLATVSALHWHELIRIIKIRELFRILLTPEYNFLSNPYFNIFHIRCIQLQDLYNFDLAKIERCSFRYATESGELISCCKYYLQQSS